jgi:hypothetical protein
MRPLKDIKRTTPEAIAALLMVESNSDSADKGMKLVKEAASFGLNLRDYLILAVDTKGADKWKGYNGYEAIKVALNLPHANDFEAGITLQAAANTFNTYAGTRAMFPEVIDDMLKFKTLQDNKVENIASIVGQSRTVSQREMISTYYEDDLADGSTNTNTIAELGKIPVNSVRTSQSSVSFGKRGSGIELSYEFTREASLDIISPFAARIARTLEKSKVAAATSILINGDGVNPAAEVQTFSSFGATGGVISAANYKALAKFLMSNANNGYVFDTFVVNFDMYVELMFMSQPVIGTATGAISPVDYMNSKGAPAISTTLPFMNGMVNVVLSSSVPAGKIIAMTKAECIEELVMAGGNISESERSIANQSITYVKTEETGYKLAVPKARVVLNVAA